STGIGREGPKVNSTGGTPAQWLGGKDNPDTMALLAGGMAQLQAVILKQMKEKDKDGDRSPEAVKPGSSALRVLPELNPATSSVDVMDWLEVITTTMQDLSDGSADWWNRARQLADDAYKAWTQATPVEKLSISPPRDEELESGKWSRVNSRGASMVTMALPDSVRQEMVQRRSTRSVTALVFRLLTIYQPGGQQEKVTILKNLQHPEQAPDAQGAVKALRSWSRWLRRCRELGVAAPDPSLLTCGLTAITKKVLEKEAEANFRTSLVRSHLMADTAPSYDTVEKYYHHLLAECETIAVATESYLCVNSSCADDLTNFKGPSKDVHEQGDVPSCTPGMAWNKLAGTEQDAVNLKEVLADVGKMLKAMSATSMKAVRVHDNKVSDSEELLMKRVLEAEAKEAEETGLLDSGASHPMRPAEEREYEDGQPVRVTLAGEDVRILRQNSHGTILVQEETAPIQPIVPLGAVIEKLGYTLHWSPRALRLTHPSKKPIQVRIKNHCPEVASEDALNLIRELEMNQVTALNVQVENLRARLEVIQKEESRDWHELLREYTRTGARPTLLKAILTSPFTKDLPSDVQSLLLEGFDPENGFQYLKTLHLTRRKRRALILSRNWVVHLFSGEYQDDPFKTIPLSGKIVLNVDIANSKLWDMNRVGGVYQLLLWAASTEGPNSYPVRTTDEPYGIKDLTAFQRQQVHNETALVGKQMMIWLLSQIGGNRNVGFLMDFPSDKDRLRKEVPVDASVWKTAMWKGFSSVSGIKEVSFYMGAYGHKAERPTTIATTYPALIQADRNYHVYNRYVPSSLLSATEMRRWSYSFKEIVADSVKDYHSAHLSEEEEMEKAGVKVSKLTKEQRESWHRHLMNGHQPYRADCSICINAQATGYQHRRRAHPSMYSMALDLAGPFKQKGRDMNHDDYRYIMVAAYRCPREYMSEKAVESLDKDYYVPDDDEVEVDDDPMGLVAAPHHVEGPSEHEAEEEVEERPREGPEILDDAVEGLSHQEEWATVFITRPLRGRTTQFVLQAAKEILLQLRQTGLHVGMVHTDRAREFKAKAFKEWTVDSQLRHTKTAGGDPAGNSSAELGIKWAKARVRALLSAAKAPSRDWPMAIQHASSSLRAKVFPDSSWAAPPATAFGNEIWFRSKAYQGKGEKKHDAAGSRWKRGWYRGPAEDVKRGHLIVREDGGLTVAKSVKFGVTDPHRELQGLLSPVVAEGLPEELLSSSEPPTKEDLKNEIEFKARKLNEERNYSLDEAVSLYKLLEMLGDTDRRLGRKSTVASWYTGAYVHGGVAGTRTNMKEFPYTTKFLVNLAKHYCGEVEFSALGLAMNAQLGLHRDLHNYSLSRNHVLPLQDFEKGALWVQDNEVDELDGVEKELPSGKKVKGRLIEMEKGKPISFSPRKWHEVQPWIGERLVLLLYTPRATKLHMDNVEFLEDMGFNVDHRALTEVVENPDDEDYVDEGLSAFPSPKIKMIRQEPRPVEGCAFVEEDDYDFLHQQVPGELPPLRDHAEAAHNGATATMMKIVKKAEVQYTKNREGLLDDVKESGKSLEVTHNVSLSDVRNNLEAWKPSAFKEFKNLKESKKAFSVKRRDELPPGCRIVPCKGVYTVKPDKEGEGFRRKPRFVACGNHIPEDDSNFDLFAAGVDATSLRTLLAANARKPWKIGTTDVRQAFVLAKWLRQPVALEPPAIAYELGLASQGQVWFVEQAIYGLRESPALWSRFRDEQLKLARWEMDVDGVPTTMRLQQMVSDNQVSKIVADGGDGKVYGYVVVYIDDLLIHAEEGAMRSFFDWVSAKWEVDALDVLDYNHPIRFLGMEMHRVPGGVELAQEGFINEILRSHGHQGGRSQSQGPRETLILSDEEERALIDAQPSTVNPKNPQVKEAQRRVGELLWLMGRTRPDLQHTVSIMAARITRCPEMVNKVGSRLLDYLNETKHYRLAFTQDSEEIATQLDIYTDSSFAPSGGRSQGAAAVFYGRSPIVWRAGRQQLVTLSTAESELLETVEGTLLGLSTRGLLTELLGRELPLVVWVDNLAAVALLTTSSGSWRTRHLRLRSNWVREMTKNNELAIKHVSGEFQRADLGTKPFTRERLRQLVAMWSIIDRRPTVEAKAVRKQDEADPWLRRLLLLCQLCGSAAQKDDIRTEIPWDLYLAVIILGIAIIGLWEGAKHCWNGRSVKVKALRAAATGSASGKITRAELKEVQLLLSVDPKDLTTEQAERLCDLKEKFDSAMPLGTSPTPRFPQEAEPVATTDEPSSSSSSLAPGRNKQPRPKATRDQATQADYEPAFTRVEPPPLPQREVIAGPFYQVPGRDHLHVFRECWGLRNAGNVKRVTLCRCCIENGGNRIY
ncbi:RE2, partial [Symbiodinium sp. CCMP2456]